MSVCFSSPEALSGIVEEMRAYSKRSRRVFAIDRWEEDKVVFQASGIRSEIVGSSMLQPGILRIYFYGRAFGPSASLGELDEIKREVAVLPAVSKAHNACVARSHGQRSSAA